MHRWAIAAISTGFVILACVLLAGCDNTRYELQHKRGERWVTISSHPPGPEYCESYRRTLAHKNLNQEFRCVAVTR